MGENMYAQAEKSKANKSRAAAASSAAKAARNIQRMSIPDFRASSADSNSLQLKAHIATRPLGQTGKEGDKDDKDRNRGFGNLKINHRHLIFDKPHDEIAAKSSTSHKDNIGFHCRTGGARGPGELFGESWPNFGYTKRSAMDDEDTAVEAVKEVDPPPRYNLITSNCQDYVTSVKNKYDRLKG